MRKLISLISRFMLLLILLIICAILSLLSPYFLTVSNFLNIARQISVNFILAAGLTTVIITGGIDLSVGSVLALAGVVTGIYLANAGNVWVAILIGLGVGTICGLVNGLFVAKARMAPFIVTLGMMSIARGLALVLTQGNSISINNPGYAFIGGGYFLGLPMPVVIALGVLIFTYIVLSRTWIGRYIYAIGGSEEAARLSGVRVERILIIVYSASGFLCGLAAVVLTSRLWAAPPIAGYGYELEAIAATVIGGTSLMGGEGSIGGTVYGAFIMGVIRNGLNLLNVSSFLQQVLIGMIIIIAVLIDRIRSRRAR